MKTLFIGAICGTIGVMIYKETVSAKNRAYIEGYKDGVDICMTLLKANIKDEKTIKEEES